MTVADDLFASVIVEANDLGWSVSDNQGGVATLTHPYSDREITLTRETCSNERQASAIKRQLRSSSSGVRTSPLPVFDDSNDLVKGPTPTSVRPARPGKTVVSMRPAKAKAGMTPKGGNVYASKTAYEVTYSDGSVDFKCQQCPETWPTLKSAGVHYGAKHSEKRGDGTKGIVKYVDPTLVWEPNARQNASLTRLAREIEKAIQAGQKTSREIAEFITSQRVRDHGMEREAGEIPVMSTDEQLAAINRVLNGGQHGEAIQEMESQVDELQEKLADAELRLEASELKSMELEAQLEEANKRIADFSAWMQLIPNKKEEA